MSGKAAQHYTTRYYCSLINIIILVVVIITIISTTTITSATTLGMGKSLRPTPPALLFFLWAAMPMGLARIWSGSNGIDR